uniref:DnaJ homolog subfamily C member 1-like n=1 Tax=Geotrypetes seraphini TaxID=260995 RepID=A0A6P8QMG8_GEOSA
NEKKTKEKEEALAQTELEALQKEKKPKVKKPKLEFPVYIVSEANVFVPSYDQGVSIEEIEEQMDDWLENRSKPPKKKAPEWTEEDLSLLTRSMVKFPGGTPGRWEKIAHELGRSVADVTTKTKQMKDAVTCTPGMARFSELKATVQNLKNAKASINLSDNILTQREEEGSHDLDEGNILINQGEITMETRHRKRKSVKVLDTTLGEQEELETKYRVRRQKDFGSIEQDEEEEEDNGDDITKKVKGRLSEELWTQNQQKLLEMALQQYPKGTSERWDKIAKCVPGKSKEECVTRYKLLVELVQKKKQAKS